MKKKRDKHRSQLVWRKDNYQHTQKKNNKKNMQITFDNGITTSFKKLIDESIFT